MPFLTEERRMIQEQAREFTLNEVLPVANKLDPEKLQGSSAWGCKLVDAKDPFDKAVEEEVATYVDENTKLKAGKARPLHSTADLPRASDAKDEL